MSNILVVDDDPDLAAAMELVLGEEGHTVFVATTYQDVLIYLRFSTQRLLMFLDMSGAGEQVLAALAADPVLLGRHEIVAFTARSARMMPPLVAQLQLPILHKPFEFAELEALVQRFALAETESASF